MQFCLVELFCRNEYKIVERVSNLFRHPFFMQRGYWAGSSMDLTKQQVLRDCFGNTVRPVAEKLKSKGFLVT